MSFACKSPDYNGVERLLDCFWSEAINIWGDWKSH
jgi:hypothetical protein